MAQGLRTGADSIRSYADRTRSAFTSWREAFINRTGNRCENGFLLEIFFNRIENYLASFVSIRIITEQFALLIGIGIIQLRSLSILLKYRAINKAITGKMITVEINEEIA